MVSARDFPVKKPEQKWEDGAQHHGGCRVFAADVPDVGKGKTGGKSPHEGGGEEVARGEMAEAGETGDGLAEYRQASGDGNAGATCAGNPGGPRGEVFFSSEACRKGASKARGELVGNLGRKEQARGGEHPAGERAVQPAQCGHYDRAGDGEEEVGDKKRHSYEPRNPAVLFEERAQGDRTQEGLEYAAPEKEGDDNGGEQKGKHEPEAAETGHTSEGGVGCQRRRRGGGDLPRSRRGRGVPESGVRLSAGFYGKTKTTV